jgi:hypothetical protein
MVRRADAKSRARTSLARVDLKFDDDGRLTSVKRAFDDGHTIVNTFVYDSSNRLAQIRVAVNESAHRAGLRDSVTTFAYEGDSTVMERGATREVLVRSGRGGSLQSDQGNFVFGPNGGGWMAERSGHDPGTKKIMLEFDGEGRPTKVLHAPEVPPYAELYEWRGDRLVSTAYSNGTEFGKTITY